MWMWNGTSQWKSCPQSTLPIWKTADAKPTFDWAITQGRTACLTVQYDAKNFQAANPYSVPWHEYVKAAKSTGSSSSSFFNVGKKFNLSTLVLLTCTTDWKWERKDLCVHILFFSSVLYPQYVCNIVDTLKTMLTLARCSDILFHIDPPIHRVDTLTTLFCMIGQHTKGMKVYITLAALVCCLTSNAIFQT